MQFQLDKCYVTGFTYCKYSNTYSIRNLTDKKYKSFKRYETELTQLISNQTYTPFDQIIGAYIENETDKRSKYIGCIFSVIECITINEHNVPSKLYVSLIPDDPCTNTLIQLNVCGYYEIKTDKRGFHYVKSSAT